MARKSIALNQSLLYDGGGTSNALQTFTTSATLVAATLDTVRISGPIAALRIDLLASAAGKGCVLAITEFRDDSPAVSEILSVREVAIPATDQTMTVDRASWGLTTATEIYAKAAVVVPVTPGRYVTISCASTDGSVSWYARVTGLDNQSASAEVNVDSASNLGNVGLVNAAETEINPATEDKQDDIITAAVGTGLPIPLTFADPASDAYTAAQATARAATRLRVIVGNSGVVISLDNGTTASISLPANSMDDVPVSIPLGTLIKVKRFTAGTAWTGLILEVR